MGPPLVDADWHVFCQAIYKGIGGSEWEELYFHYRDEQGGRSQKKAERESKSKSPLVHEGSQGQEGRNSMIQLAKKTFLGRKQTRPELREERF